MGEFDLIRRYFDWPSQAAPAGGGPSHPLLGIGDDCALLRAPVAGQVLAVSTDMLVAGTHFFDGTDPAAVGHKTLAVNLSDLAAMGAEPVGFTLAIALPAVDHAWLAAFSTALRSLAGRFACPLVGGDTTRGPLCLSVTVFGQVPPALALRRDGAAAGDDIWVSGSLGGAALAVAARRASLAVPAGAAVRLDWPEPRLPLGLALRGLASAAIDLSDGLGGDLRHLLEASGRRQQEALGAELRRAALPLDPVLDGLDPARALRLALAGGDDYELLFTAAPGHRATIAALAADGRVALSRVGRVTRGRGMLVLDPDGRATTWEGGGFDHFDA